MTFGIPQLAKYDMHFPTWAIGQVQDGKRIVVWPKEFAAPGARRLVP